MVTQLSEKQLKTLISQSVGEIIDAKFMKLRALFSPYISQKEQKEIERLYKKPSRKIAKTYELKI